MPSIYLDRRSNGAVARIRSISPEAIFALMVVYDVYREHHEVVAISCGTDGTHNPSSRHYTGDAFDVRNPKDSVKRDVIVRELRGALGADFQVIPEDVHIHVQYRPADPLNLSGAAVGGE